MSTGMAPDWAPLEAELAKWQSADLRLPLWWRDDDAVEPAPQLERLCSLARDLRVPVHLAVIPAAVQTELASYVAQHAELIPVVHGWAHLNHASKGEKKCEFPAQRPRQVSLEDMQRGLSRLQQVFGTRLVAMFVPPWNRITSDLVPALADLGFAALSTFTPRQAAFAAPGLAQINTHLDPIDWKDSRSLVAPEHLIAQVCGQLRDRRKGTADNTEPYGILTHHLVHDEAIWGFTEALISRLMQGPGRVWNFDTKDDLT